MAPDAVAGATSQEIVIEVLRYRSEVDWKPVPQVYRVPFTDDMSVLQGLQYIKDHLDGRSISAGPAGWRSAAAAA